MRKFLISAALLASTVAVAAPASAQWYPQQPAYGYGQQPYGNAYGYNNYGQVRRLQVRIDQIQRQIVQLDRRNILSNREAGRLRAESRNLEQRLRYVGRNGLSGGEAYDIERRIQQLEYRIQREARDGNNWRGDPYGNNGYGYNYDRDRDGLDDRYERDRGTNYDEDRDPD
jgi:hypothetical protein